ncbi:uncharacterized protein N7515_006931 [Penicillium bovifimosum]|uniref:Uncharacterized protein n=1 Tax=Penicillium bovifimosum TaxID=126998 RepID=A0A9W9L1Q1_9EURO|nr:uncharacterized protein N7515_006931 [Penicillium bovifimosum]KAJ5130892.1 hypothetical protein N7515_006931 [Penicillium bovifimosum]
MSITTRTDVVQHGFPTSGTVPKMLKLYNTLLKRRDHTTGQSMSTFPGHRGATVNVDHLARTGSTHEVKPRKKEDSTPMSPRIAKSTSGKCMESPADLSRCTDV